MKVFFKTKSKTIKSLKEENKKLKAEKLDLETDMCRVQKNIQDLLIENDHLTAKCSKLERQIENIENKNNQTRVFNEWLYGSKPEGE